MILNNLISLWLVPYSLRFLSREEFGLYHLCTDILLWLALINLGTPAVFNTRVAQAIGENKARTELSALLSTAFYSQMAFGLLIALSGFGLSFFINDFFKVAQNEESFRIAFIILTISAAITLVRQVFSSLLIANKQIHLDNLIQVAFVLPRVVFSIILLQNGFGILALAITQLLITVLSLLGTVYLTKKYVGTLSLSFTLFDKSHLKDFLGKGFWFTIGGVAGILILNVDRLMIAKVVSVSLVANFIINQKLYFLFDKIISQLINTSRPYFSQLSVKNKKNSIYELYTFLVTSSLSLCALFAILIFAFNKHFIAIWVGADFYMGDVVNLFLALNFFLQSAVLTKRVLLSSVLFKIKEHSSVRLVEGMVNLILSFLFARYFQTAGVIMASVLASFVFSNLVLTTLIKQYFKQNSIPVDMSIYLPYLFVLLLVVQYYIQVRTSGIFLAIAFIIVSVLVIFFYLATIIKANPYFVSLRQNIGILKFFTFQSGVPKQ